MNLKSLSDQRLLESAREAAKTERNSAIVVLHHLLEVERRRLFGPMYSSLHAYAVGELKYSDSAAYRRIAAMRVLKILPEIEEKIESGSLSLTTLSQAQAFFQQEERVEKCEPLAKWEVLAALESKSSRQVDRELIGRSTEPLALKKDRVRVVSETLSELKCLVKDETLQDLDQLRGLLAHQHPSLSMGELLGIAIKLALQSLDPAKEPKRKVPAKPAPEVNAQQTASGSRRAKPAPVSRYIKAQVKRDVWKRAGGKCQKCGSFHRLQIDHIHPHALGGSNQIENLRLLCFHCNHGEADRKLGREKMESKRTQATRTAQTNLSPPQVPDLAGGARPQSSLGSR